MRARRQRAPTILVGGLLIAALGLALAAEGSASAEPGDAGSASRDAAQGDREAGQGARDAAQARIAPDPPALAERMQWVFDLRWEREEVYLVAVHKTDMDTPHPTPRVMGRFAIELYEGPTLVERARFDFPMLGAEEPPDAGWKTPPRFMPKLKTRIGVVFPATKRGTRLELWDRATDRRWPLPWPPTEGIYGADAGARPARDSVTAPRDAGPG